MSPIDILRRANNEAIERIQHADPNCTGKWRIAGVFGNRRVQCDLCNAEHPATPENRQAAVDENSAGTWLKHLAVCGAQLLEKERRDHA